MTDEVSLFEIKWPTTWDRLFVGRDRRDGCIYLYRKYENAFASLSAFVPVAYVQQETIGL